MIVLDLPYANLMTRRVTLIRDHVNNILNNVNLQCVVLLCKYTDTPSDWELRKTIDH